MKTFLLSLFSAFFISVPTDKTIYDFKMKNIDGNEISLSDYKGKVVLIVNVASKCGHTPQYKDLQALYAKYKDKGFVILGFPANNFLRQEPGSDEKIKAFCMNEYTITFPMFSKISVKGKNIAPLYNYLTKKTENGTLDAKVKWNFQKFLIAKNGKVITSFSPRKLVTDADVIKAIERSL